MKSIVSLLAVMVILSLSVNAISVASDYLANGTLELPEGASKIYSIRLQNPTDNEISIKLDYDAAFMKAIDYKEVYIVAPKTAGYRIEFNVTAPQKPGLYAISYTVSEVEPSAGGGLPILLKINKNFKLRVIEGLNRKASEVSDRILSEDPNKFSIAYSGLAFAVMLLIAVFFLFIKKKGIKKKNNRKVNKEIA